MRWAWLALLLALPPQENKFAIEGTIVRLGTTEPLEGIEVTLIRPSADQKLPRTPELQAVMETLAARPQYIDTPDGRLVLSANARSISDGEKKLGLPPGSLLPPEITKVTTDSAGKFAFKGLSSGPHTLRAEREGFFTQQRNGCTGPSVSRRISVDADHALTRVEFEMCQGGMISGRVLDPDGRPVCGVRVHPSQITYDHQGLGPFENGRLMPLLTHNGTSTDCKGEYWLTWLPPGRYYIEAAPPRDKEWVRTLFPNAKDPSTATLVTVSSDVVTEGIDISFRPEESRLFTISGIAVNPLLAGGTGNRAVRTFLLAPREPGVMDPEIPPESAIYRRGKDGEFEIQDVRPGKYDLYGVYWGSFDSVESRSSISRIFFGRTPVEVRDEDVKDVQLTIRPGVDLNGRVIFNGSRGNPAGLRVFLRVQETMPRHYMKAFEAIPVDSSGKFHAEQVPEGRLKLSLGGLPEGAYVEDIRQGGRSVFDDGFFLYGQSDTVEVVVNTRGLVVEGIVENSERKPVPNVTVVLVPPEQQRRNPSRYRAVISDETGKFSMKTVPPGIYTAYAWEGVLPYSWLDDDFYSKYQGQGKIVNVVPNSRIQLQLLAIPSDEQ